MTETEANAGRGVGRMTGPQTAAGKRRSRRNSLRHGLAATTLASADQSGEAMQLARLLAGEFASPVALARALDVASATLDIRRARRAKLDVLRQSFSISEQLYE